MPVSSTKSGLQTVEFHGDKDLTLVGDEWNRGAPSAAAHPTILMLHGGGQNRFSWKNTGQVLADQGFHVIALDARGHGDSDRAPNAEYTVDALSRDVLAVLDQIGRPAVLIGASMGGLTSILVAHLAGPQKVTKLVLVDVVPRVEQKGASRIHDFMVSHVHGFENLQQAADAISEYLPHRKRPKNLDGLKKNLRHRDGRWFWHWDPAFLQPINDDPFVRAEELEQGIEHLERVGASVLGVVVNNFDPHRAYGITYRRLRHRYYSYGGYQRQRPTPPPSVAKKA